MLLTGPSTVQFEDKILTSPTVYSSFETLCGWTSGLDYGNSVLPSGLHNVLILEDLRSMSTACVTDQGLDVGNNVLSSQVTGLLNHTDLNARSESKPCSCAVGDSANGATWDNSKPMLMLPTELPNLNLSWKSCAAGVGLVQAPDGSYLFGNFILDSLGVLQPTTMDLPTITIPSSAKISQGSGLVSRHPPSTVQPTPTGFPQTLQTTSTW